MDEVLDRKKLTFKQAEGIEELPQPLTRNELSQKLRALLWRTYNSHVLLSPDHNSSRLRRLPCCILRDDFVERLHKPVTKFNNDYYYQQTALEELFFNGSYADVMEHLLFVLRHPQCPNPLKYLFGHVFKECQSPWRILYEGKDTTFFPAINEQEEKTLELAYNDLKKSAFGGGMKHLVNAGNTFSDGKWNDSIRESITAVESVAKKIANNPNADLRAAIGTIKTAGVTIHPAFEKALLNLYGYTSDEKGIRHAQIEADHQCDQATAQFMLGTCASFISYLLNKAKKS